MPIITSLEMYYAKDTPSQAETKSSSTQPKVVQITMSLDRSAQDITKELKKKMRVLDRGNFNGTRSSFGRGHRSTFAD